MNISVEHPEPAGAAHANTPFGMRRTSSVILSPAQHEAANFLETAARGLEPLAALAGVAGIGKTVALAEVLARLESNGRRILRISNFVAGPLNLHRTICASLGVERTNELSADEIAPALHKALADAGYDAPPVLAVDDAQSLLPETLEYLRMISGLREAGRPSFCILLVGRPGFTRLRSFSQLFTLQPAQTGDAARIVRQSLAAIGANAPDLIIRELVAEAAGNLRTLDTLLQARIEQGRSGGITRGGAARGHTNPGRPTQAPLAAPIRRRSRGQRSAFSGLGLWGAAIAVPVLMGIGATALLHHRQAPLPLEAAQHESEPAPAPKTPPQASIAQPAMSSVAAPALQPSQPAAPAAPETTPQPPPQREAQQSALPAPTPPSAAMQPSPALVPPALTHFRVYNIGPCPNRVCHRWAVTDLDHNKRFVAGFDAATLRLDPDLAAKARLGAVELTVGGTLVSNISGGKQVVATELESVAPHHSRSQAASPPPALTPPPEAPAPIAPLPFPGGWSNVLQPSQENATRGTAQSPAPPDQTAPVPSQPIERSPPPGFLKLPASEAASSPTSAPQALPPPVPPQVPQRNRSDNWMSEPVVQAPLPAPVPPPISTGPN